jgi:hypothetical protein
MTPTTWHDGAGPRMIKKSRCALVSVNANRTATRFFDRCGVARSRFVRVATAGCALRVAPARELVEVGVPVLPPDRDADPAAGAEDAGAEGDEGDEGAVAGRVGAVAIGGATGVVGDGVVVRGGVGTVPGGAGAGGSAVVIGSEGAGGGGAGGSVVVTGGGGGGSAVVTGSEGGGGSAVVTGSDGVVTVTPGTGGSSRARACATTTPARAAAKPKKLPKRDIPTLQRPTPANGCGPVTYAGVLSSSASGSGAWTGSCESSWPCSWSWSSPEWSWPAAASSEPPENIDLILSSSDMTAPS